MAAGRVTADRRTITESMSASVVPPTKAWETNGPSSNASHGTVPVIADATNAPNAEPDARNTSSTAVTGTSTASAH